jgi:hypothetical protein
MNLTYPELVLLDNLDDQTDARHRGAAPSARRKPPSFHG